MTIFRVRFDVAGGHVHCRLAAAKGPDQTWATCGTFVVRKGEEFESLLKAFKADFVGEKEDVGIAAAIED